VSFYSEATRPERDLATFKNVIARPDETDLVRRLSQVANTLAPSRDDHRQNPLSECSYGSGWIATLDSSTVKP
jgi:hypothetical protein